MAHTTTKDCSHRDSYTEVQSRCLVLPYLETGTLREALGDAPAHHPALFPREDGFHRQLEGDGCHRPRLPHRLGQTEEGDVVAALQRRPVRRVPDQSLHLEKLVGEESMAEAGNGMERRAL